MVAVRAATVRIASHKNAASSCAALMNRGVPALHRASGVAPVEEWTRTWVLVLGPGGEPAVQLIQAVRHPAAGGGLAVRGDLDQELASDRLEKTFDLTAALRPVRRRMSDQDAQLRAGHRERLIDKARPVINVSRARQAPGRNGPLEHRSQVQRVLAPPPPVPGDEPGMVVQEGEKIGLLP